MKISLTIKLFLGFSDHIPGQEGVDLSGWAFGWAWAMGCTARLWQLIILIPPNMVNYWHGDMCIYIYILGVSSKGHKNCGACSLRSQTWCRTVATNASLFKSFSWVNNPNQFFQKIGETIPWSWGKGRFWDNIAHIENLPRCWKHVVSHETGI